MWHVTIQAGGEPESGCFLINWSGDKLAQNSTGSKSQEIWEI